MSSQPAGDPWDVFDYEAGMFLQLLRFLSTGNPDFNAFPKPVRYAIVEIALLHIRQLADTLLDRGSRSTDITLRVLLPNFKPDRIDEFKLAYGGRDISGSPCEIINTRLAHATTYRTIGQDYSPLLNQLAPTLTEIRVRSGTSSWADAGGGRCKLK